MNKKLKQQIEAIPIGKPGQVMGLEASRPLPELIEDKEAIREALKESRRSHTVRVKPSLLP